MNYADALSEVRELREKLEDAYKTIRALVGHSGESCPALSCPHERAVREAVKGGR